MHLSIDRYADGYTMLEMAIVLVLLGILGASAALRMTAVSQHDVLDQADVLRRDIARVQAIAMAQGVALRLTAASSGYTVSCLTTASGTPCDAVGKILKDPATGSNVTVALQNGVGLLATDANGAAATVTDFDSLGRPWSGAALIASNPARIFRLSAASRTATVALRPISGFTEVSY